MPDNEYQDGAIDARSLYDRLGGINAIGAVVLDFVERIVEDPVLNANPKLREAHERVTVGGFAYLITEFVAEAAGGPQQYSGRTMIDSHADLAITEPEWDAFMHSLDQSMFKFEVPARERAEVVAFMETFRADIVTAQTAPVYS